MPKVLDFIAQNWGVILPIIYEVGARVTPTKRNLSILDLAMKIIGIVIKNRRKVDGTERGIEDEGKTTTNLVPIDITKHIIK